MSTVHETIVARHCGLRVLAVSAITNLAEGMSDVPLSHEQTLRDGERAAGDLSAPAAGLPAADRGAMLAAELIRRKRDGGELSADEIVRAGGRASPTASVSDAQVGALAMAIFCGA